MKRWTVLSILTSGLTIALLSALGSYYWAISNKSSTSTKRTKTVQKTPPKTQADSTSDTSVLRADNWKSFLSYEGTRKRMLGIERMYTTVNFRKGPSTTYEIVQTPSGGDLLLPLDRDNNWYRARLESGQIGWIHKSLVRILEVPKPIYSEFTKKLPPIEKSIQKLIPESFFNHTLLRVSVQKANIRRGPGTQFTLIGSSYRHELLRLLGKDGNWFRVRTKTMTEGWIRDDLLKPLWLRPREKWPKIQVKTVNLSMGPEFQLRSSASELKTNTVKILEKNDPWYLVYANKNKIGWIHTDDFKKSNQPPIELPAVQSHQADTLIQGETIP